MLTINIADPATKKQARIDNSTETNGLVVATRQLKTFENTSRFFTNSEFGPDMNINATASGTPIEVYNGTDDDLWTASSVQGVKFTFNSIDQNHTPLGAASIKVDNASLNDIFEVNKGSSQDLTGFSALSMWIYVDKDWFSNDSISVYGWDSVAGIRVGTPVFLQNYFDWLTFGKWHYFIVSLEDMGLHEQNIDSLRFEVTSIDAKSPKFYIDDIQLEEVGQPVSFEIKADKQTWLHVQNFQFSVVAAYDGILADSTFPKIPYDSVLGVQLINGLVYQREQNGIIQFSQTLKSLMDTLQIPGTTISGQGSDGVNSWITVCSRNTEPLVLKSENDDVLSFSVSDNLSSLLHFRIAVGAGIEDRRLVHV